MEQSEYGLKVGEHKDFTSITPYVRSIEGGAAAIEYQTIMQLDGEWPVSANWAPIPELAKMLRPRKGDKVFLTRKVTRWTYRGKRNGIDDWKVTVVTDGLIGGWEYVGKWTWKALPISEWEQVA